MKQLILAAALALTGCATVSTGTIATEATWQALNVVDTGQSISMARNPDRFEESDPITRHVAGEHPSQGRVYAVMGAYAFIHAGVSVALDQKDPGSGGWHAASIAWQALTLGDKAHTVIENSRQVDPWMGTHLAPAPVAVPVTCAANHCTNN